MSILRWPGGKARLLPALREQLDPLLDDSRVMIDAFVGGGSVLLDVARRYRKMRLQANDLDAGVSVLWRVIVGADEPRAALTDLILTTTPTLDLWDAMKVAAPSNDVESAFQTLFINRTSFSGNLTGGPLGGRRQDRSKITDRWNPKQLVQDVEDAHEILVGRTVVTCLDAAEVARVAIDQPRTTTYLDPVYLGVGNSLYRQGMTLGDHERLAAALRHGGRWVLSYDDHPTVHEMYAWANIMPVGATYTVARAAGRRARRQELIITPNQEGGARQVGASGGSCIAQSNALV